MMEWNREINIAIDFWDDFVLEAFEHIEEIETNVITLEQTPDDMEILNTMFRAYHTIKGLAGFCEHTIIQEIAHKTETLMDYCRKGELKVSTQIVDAILKSSDYIKRLCEEIESYKDDAFIQKIDKLVTDLEILAERQEQQVSTPQEPLAYEAVEQNVAAQEDDFFSQAAVPEVEMNFEPTFENVSQTQEVVQEPVSEEKSQEELSQEEFFAQYKKQLGLVEEAKVEPEQPKITESYSEPVSQEQQEESLDEGLAAFLEETTADKIVIPEEEVQEESQEEEIHEEVLAQYINSQETQIEHKEEVKEEVVKAQAVQPVSISSPEVAVVKEPALAGVSAASNSFEQAPKPAPSPSVAPAVKQEVNLNDNGPKKFASNEEHMKVANSKIDHLVDMIGELIINQSLIEQYISSNYSGDNQLITNMSGFLRITRELQNLSMSLRMVSLKSTFQKVSRIARDTIQELGKNVEFVTSGDSTEIDRVVTDKLLDPLVHLIKNAISHGVESSPADREAVGKNPKAKVELNAYNKRGKIYIEVKDDGRGINTEVVYKKALEKGLIDPNHSYTEDEIKEFILLPGFSTAAVVDNISGRGVGMDVVKTQILKIGGKVTIDSKLGKGSTFTLEVPVNHAIMNGTVIDINGQQLIVPTINVKEILQPAQNQWIFTQQRRTMLRVRDNIISIIPSSLFSRNGRADGEVPLVMLLELDGELRALPIDNVINRQEVVVKPVGEEFSHLKYISGMSILGTGKVSLILDIDYLFKKEVKE